MPEPTAPALTAPSVPALTAGPLPPHSTDTTDGAWDGPANEARCPATRGPLRASHAWVDSAANPDAKSSYKFIHHAVGLDGAIGAANLTACSTGIGYLNGSRRGTTIPASDRAGVHAHLAAHLQDGGQDAPELARLHAEPTRLPFGPAVRALCNAYWAMLPGSLQVMLGVASRGDLYPEALAAAQGTPLDNTHCMTVLDGVATLPVCGPLCRYMSLFSAISGGTSMDCLAQDFAAALADPDVTAILLNIDSPGGEVNGVAEFAAQVYAARGQKPIGAYIGGTGASGAYWLAAACSHITVASTALVGGLGVIASFPGPNPDDPADLEFVSSQTPHKAPDLTTDSGAAQVQGTVDALAAVFLGDMARYRGVPLSTVQRDFGQGDVLVGQAAVDAGLADTVGSEASAAQRLRDSRPGALPLPMSLPMQRSVAAHRAALVRAQARLQGLGA